MPPRQYLETDSAERDAELDHDFGLNPEVAESFPDSVEKGSDAVGFWRRVSEEVWQTEPAAETPAKISTSDKSHSADKPFDWSATVSAATDAVLPLAVTATNSASAFVGVIADSFVATTNEVVRRANAEQLEVAPGMARDLLDETETEKPALQAVAEAKSEMPSHPAVADTKSETPSHQAVADIKFEMPSHQPVAEGKFKMPSHQPVAEGKFETPSHQPVAEGKSEMPSHQAVADAKSEMPSPQSLAETKTEKLMVQPAAEDEQEQQALQPQPEQERRSPVAAATAEQAMKMESAAASIIGVQPFTAALLAVATEIKSETKPVNETNADQPTSAHFSAKDGAGYSPFAGTAKDGGSYSPLAGKAKDGSPPQDSIAKDSLTETSAPAGTAKDNAPPSGAVISKAPGEQHERNHVTAVIQDHAEQTYREVAKVAADIATPKPQVVVENTAEQKPLTQSGPGDTHSKLQFTERAASTATQSSNSDRTVRADQALVHTESRTASTQGGKTDNEIAPPGRSQTAFPSYDLKASSQGESNRAVATTPDSSKLQKTNDAAAAPAPGLVRTGDTPSSSQGTVRTNDVSSAVRVTGGDAAARVTAAADPMATKASAPGEFRTEAMPTPVVVSAALSPSNARNLAPTSEQAPPKPVDSLKTLIEIQINAEPKFSTSGAIEPATEDTANGGYFSFSNFTNARPLFDPSQLGSNKVEERSSVFPVTLTNQALLTSSLMRSQLNLGAPIETALTSAATSNLSSNPRSSLNGTLTSTLTGNPNSGYSANLNLQQNLRAAETVRTSSESTHPTQGVITGRLDAHREGRIARVNESSIRTAEGTRTQEQLVRTFETGVRNTAVRVPYPLIAGEARIGDAQAIPARPTDFHNPGNNKRYLITEIGLAFVIAAGGIRRVLPSDKAPPNTPPGDGKRGTEKLLPTQKKQPVSAAELSSKFAPAKDIFKPLATRIQKPRELRVEQLQPRLASQAVPSKELFQSLKTETRKALNVFSLPTRAALSAEGYSGNFVDLNEPFLHSVEQKRAEATRNATRRHLNKPGADREKGHGNRHDDDLGASTPTVLSRPTWLIAPGESLVSIAENLYSDPNLGWLIADLNKAISEEHFIDGKRVVEFHSRQRLTLPVWQDVEDFYSSRPAPADHDDLITIVKTTKLDRQVVESALARVMGTTLPAPASISSLGSNDTAGSTEEL